MSVLTRAIRNVSRRKDRVMLVVVALSLSMAILVSIPAGILANQEAAEELKANYEGYLDDISEEVIQSIHTTGSSLWRRFCSGQIS